MENFAQVRPICVHCKGKGLKPVTRAPKLTNAGAKKKMEPFAVNKPSFMTFDRRIDGGRGLRFINFWKFVDDLQKLKSKV